MFKKISVIIPFFNRKAVLLEAVESVFRQTTGDIECILVDDGSTDGGLAAAEDLWAKLVLQADDQTEGSRQLKTLSLSHCGFPGAVRNRGVEMASHPLIAFLDSDDIWYSHKLERQLALHQQGKVRISHTRERWLRWNQQKTAESNFREISQKSQKHRRSGDIFGDALWKCIIGPSTVVMERSLYNELGGFREDLEVAEDYEFWLRVTAKEEVGYVDEACIAKRAGMADQNQLSERYGFIEGFRISALEAFLESGPEVSPARMTQIREVLKKKAEIYRNGAVKRNRSDVVADMDRIIATHCVI